MNEIDEIVVTERQAAAWDCANPGVKKYSTSGYGSGPFKLRDQCVAGMSEDHRCISDGKNPPGAGGENLVGGS